MTTWENLTRQITLLEEGDILTSANSRIEAIRRQLQGLSGKKLNPDDDRDAIASEFQKLGEERSQLQKDTVEPTTAEIRRLRGIRKQDRGIITHSIETRVQRARGGVSGLLMPDRVLSLMDMCPNIVSTPRVTKYLNLDTQWDNMPRLYFGMGGGSQQLTKAFPMGVINMLFASEFLRRQLGLASCTVICGDVMTKTNPFPHADIDRIITGEQNMIQYLVDLFGFENWNIVFMSELHGMHNSGMVWRDNIFTVDPQECLHPEYVEGLRWWYRYIDEGIKASPYSRLGFDSRGHEDNWHFAMESAITHYVVGNGIHYGWYIPGPDIPDAATMERIIEKYGLPKVMDEQPFDEFYTWTHRLIRQAGGFTEPDLIPPIQTCLPARVIISSENRASTSFLYDGCLLATSSLTAQGTISLQINTSLHPCLGNAHPELVSSACSINGCKRSG